MDRHATPVAPGVPTLLRMNSVVSALESASLMVPALPERPADRGGGLLGSLPARERVLCVDALFFLKRRPGNRSIAAALKARLPSHRFRFVAGSGMRAAGSGGLRCGSGAGQSGGGRRRGAGLALSLADFSARPCPRRATLPSRHDRQVRVGRDIATARNLLPDVLSPSYVFLLRVARLSCILIGSLVEGPD